MGQDAVRVVKRADWGPAMGIVTGGECHPVIWPGMGAVERSLHHFSLPAGTGTVPLEHPSEAVYYVVAGSVDVDDLSADGDPTRVVEGGMFHVEPATRYSFRSTEDGTRVIGGACPVDPSLYEPMKGSA